MKLPIDVISAYRNYINEKHQNELSQDELRLNEYITGRYVGNIEGPHIVGFHEYDYLTQNFTIRNNYIYIDDLWNIFKHQSINEKNNNKIEKIYGSSINEYIFIINDSTMNIIISDLEIKNVQNIKSIKLKYNNKLLYQYNNLEETNDIKLNIKFHIYTNSLLKLHIESSKDNKFNTKINYNFINIEEYPIKYHIDKIINRIENAYYICIPDHHYYFKFKNLKLTENFNIQLPIKYREIFTEEWHDISIESINKVLTIYEQEQYSKIKIYDIMIKQYNLKQQVLMELVYHPRFQKENNEIYFKDYKDIIKVNVNN